MKFYVKNGGKLILMRFDTGAFGSKWCGVWRPPLKLIEYWAFKVDDEWLSPQNCMGFDGKRHLYELKGMRVEEEVLVGDGVKIRLRFKGKRKGKVKVQMEVGINIRRWEENAHDRRYEVIGKRDGFLVKNELGSVRVGGGKFLRGGLYRRHLPGAYHDWDWLEEEQSVFVPGILEKEVDLRKVKEVTFYIEKRDFEPREMGFGYLSDFGFCYLAGFPWFLQFWTRDACFVMLNEIKKGNLKAVKEALLTISKFERDGEIPTKIELDGKAYYYSVDVPGLFVISLCRYLEASKDKKMREKMRGLVNRILRKRMEGLIESYGKDTWMDSLERDGYCLDVQSVWAEAFRSAGKVYGRADWVRRGEKIVRVINEEFWTGDFLLDRLGEDDITANALFPLFFKQLPKDKARKVLKRLESEEFTTERGIRCRSSEDELYDPDEYHLGRVWGLLTGMMIVAEENYGRPEKAEKYKEIIERNKGLRCIDGVDETYDGDSLIPMGCCKQAWSEVWV